MQKLPPCLLKCIAQNHQHTTAIVDTPNTAATVPTNRSTDSRYISQYDSHSLQSLSSPSSSSSSSFVPSPPPPSIPHSNSRSAIAFHIPHLQSPAAAVLASSSALSFRAQQSQSMDKHKKADTAANTDESVSDDKHVSSVAVDHDHVVAHHSSGISHSLLDQSIVFSPPPTLLFSDSVMINSLESGDNSSSNSSTFHSLSSSHTNSSISLRKRSLNSTYGNVAVSVHTHAVEVNQKLKGKKKSAKSRSASTIEL